MYSMKIGLLNQDTRQLKMGGGGWPPHQSWSSYLLLLISLMAYNTWGCVTKDADDFHLRLHAGRYNGSGFVQYKHNGNWYRVCTLGWKSTEAEAFCFSLGCMGFVGFRDDYVQAPVMGETMFITYAKCRGTENSLAGCVDHRWKQVSEEEAPECYTRSSREIVCSAKPPVTPTVESFLVASSTPAPAAFAIADGPKTPKNLVANQQQFASLQAATTTTMSPQQLLAETLKCFVDPDNCIFNVQSTTEAPAQPMPAASTSSSSTSKQVAQTTEEETTTEIPTSYEGSPATKPSTATTDTGAMKQTTTKPVFTSPYTGPTNSRQGSSFMPTEGSTARPPVGVSPYGDNKECPGFVGTYQMESATSGSINSPNYPNNYPTNIRCRWVIRVESGEVVKFNFKDFKIHQYDYVRIYDTDPTGTLIADLSGDMSDPNRVPVSNTTRKRRDVREVRELRIKRATPSYAYETTGDQAVLDFYSDDSNTDKGFASSFSGGAPSSGASIAESAPNNNWIIIVVILLLLLLLILVLICIYCWWKNKKEQQNKCGFVIRDEKQLLYTKDGKMTVDPKSDYNAVAKSVESLFCVEGENDKANLIEGYKDTIVVFDNPNFRHKGRSGSQASLEQKSEEVKQQMARSGIDPPSRPGSGMRTPRPFVKDGVVMMLPKTNNYVPDEGEPTVQMFPPKEGEATPTDTPRKTSATRRDSKVAPAPLDPTGSNVKSTITMNPRSEASTDPEGVFCANNKYSIVATVDGKKFGELDPVGSVPPDFLCPITNKLMKNPVMGSDGKSYERKAIVAWLAKKPTSPVTDEPMKEEDLKPNGALKSRIKQWKRQKEVTKDRADREASASHTSAIGDIDC